MRGLLIVPFYLFNIVIALPAIGAASSSGLALTKNWVTTFAKGEQVDFDALDWQEVNDLSSVKLTNINDDVCVTGRSESVNMPAWGDWWTSWCELDDLTTATKGQMINVPSTLIMNTELYVNATMSPLMQTLLASAVGFDTTHPKGKPSNMGCTNVDGLTHGIWVQEHMGWGKQIQTVTYTDSGTGCQPPPPASIVQAQLNWPDPSNTGFRAFGMHCDWAASLTNLCVTNSPYNIAGNT